MTRIDSVSVVVVVVIIVIKLLLRASHTCGLFLYTRHTFLVHRCNKRLQRLPKTLTARVCFFVNVYYFTEALFPVFGRLNSESETD